MKNFITILEKFGPFEHNPVLSVALSGGSDSLALTLIANEYIKNKSGKIVALTVDHKLRKESTDEALKLHSMIKDLGIEHHILSWNKENPPTSNIQSQARNARYKLLTDFCNKHHILHLLVAHHKNDQIETFMMRLERGSGVKGLSSMNEVSYFNKVRILRPLLNIHPDELKNYLKKLNIPWFEDPSNSNEKFTRIKFRMILKNHDNLILDRIFNTSIFMRRAYNSIKQNLYSKMIKMLKLYPVGYATIDIKLLLDLSEEESLRILANVLTTIGGNEYPPRYQSLQRLYTEINNLNFVTCTLGGCKILKKKKLLIIYKELSNIKKNDQSIDCKTLVWDNRFLITFKENNFIIKSGIIKVNYFNHQASELKKIINESKIPNKVPKYILNTSPVFNILDKIIAAPYIGYYDSKDIEEHIKCSFMPKRSLTEAL